MDFPVGGGSVCLKQNDHDYEEYVSVEFSLQLPVVGEWTRVELTREYDDIGGKYFISLSFDGVEVIRDEDFFVYEANPDVELWDIRIGLGELNVQQFPGFIRRLIVLEKS